MKMLKKINITFLIITVVVLLSICSYVYVLLDVRSELKEQKNSYLNNLTSELGNLVSAKIDERFTALETLTYIVRDDSYGHVGAEELFLSEYAANEGMVKIEILPYGESYTLGDDNTIVNEQDEAGNKLVCLYVPVEMTGGPGFVIKGTYDAEVFAKLVSTEMLGQSKNTFLVSREGEVVASKNSNYTLEAIFGGDKVYVNTLKNHIASRTKGHIIFSSGNNDRYVCYAGITYNDWYVIAIVSSNLVEENYEEVNSRGIILSVILFVIILFMMAYIIYFSYQYNFYKKIVAERRNIYAEETERILFDYKVKKKYIELSDNASAMTGILPAGENSFDDIKPFLTEESFADLKTALNTFNEQDKVQCEIELVKEEENCGKYRMSMVPIKTKNGKLVRVVGSMEPMT